MGQDCTGKIEKKDQINMSFLDTRQALLTKLIDSGIIPVGDIAHENKNFDPSGKDLWISIHFLPTTNEALGKSSGSSNDDHGIFQISVFVKKNADDYDVTLLTTIDLLIKEFYYNSQASLNGQVVGILETTSSDGSDNESWHKRDISINYLTFSTR